MGEANFYYFTCLNFIRKMDETKDLDELRGRPKSGRFWKTTQTQRCSAMKQDKGGKKTWDTKVAERLKKKLEKEYEKNLKEEKKKKMEILKKREKEKREKKRENEKKGEVVIPIKDTTKIKRMKKKQLKYIQKR